MSLSEIDILTEENAWLNVGFDVDAETKIAVSETLDLAKWRFPLSKEHSICLSIMLGNDATIRELNRQFRHKDKPTNVLSFASIDDPDFALAASLPGPFHLGDLALAWETISAEAEEQHKTLHDHFTHLLIHGTLHLLGYDHEVEAEAEEMEALEIHILKSLGIENPYAAAHFMPD